MVALSENEECFRQKVHSKNFK